MSLLFGSHDMPEPEISEEKIAQALEEIRQNARNRRLAFIAPVALAAAVLATFAASPQRYGGLSLLPDASASNPALPRVFGADGFWHLPETIAEGQTEAPTGPASIVEAPADPAPPNYVLVPPTQGTTHSLPVSTSTPPTSTPGQSLQELQAEASVGEPDAGDADPVAAPTFLPIVIEQAGAKPAGVDGSAEPRAGEPTSVVPGPKSTSLASVSSAPAGPTTTPQLSSRDEDVSVVETQPTEPTDGVTASANGNIGDPSGANPSTPPDDPVQEEVRPLSQVASIVPLTVLVHSAHVSVTVQVVDDDSSVIDWCNTRVDWGDGSVTRVTLAEEIDVCASQCDQQITGSVGGIDEKLIFEHEYLYAIDAAPRIFVATGDGCNYNLAEFQLRSFTVVPY